MNKLTHEYAPSHPQNCKPGRPFVSGCTGRNKSIRRRRGRFPCTPDGVRKIAWDRVCIRATVSCPLRPLVSPTTQGTVTEQSSHTALPPPITVRPNHFRPSPFPEAVSQKCIQNPRQIPGAPHRLISPETRMAPPGTMALFVDGAHRSCHVAIRRSMSELGARDPGYLRSTISTWQTEVPRFSSECDAIGFCRFTPPALASRSVSTLPSAP